MKRAALIASSAALVMCAAGCKAPDRVEGDACRGLSWSGTERCLEQHEQEPLRQLAEADSAEQNTRWAEEQRRAEEEARTRAADQKHAALVRAPGRLLPNMCQVIRNGYMHCADAADTLYLVRVRHGAFPVICYLEPKAGRRLCQPGTDF